MDPSQELVELCRDTTGSRMASSLTDMYPDVDMAPDIAMLAAIKKGNFTMNSMFQDGTKVTGVSPFSCPPLDAHSSKGSYHLARAKIEAGESVTHTLTEDDLKLITQQNFYVPSDQLEFLVVMENYLHMLKIVFTDSSHIHMKTKDFFKKVQLMREPIKMYARKHDQFFYMSFFGHLHMKIARYVNGIIRDPSSGRREDLNFEDILTSLQITSFMNNYALPMLGDSKSTGDSSSNGGNSGSSQSSSNNSGRGGSGGNGSNHSGNKRNNRNGENSDRNGRPKRRKVLNSHVSDTRSEVVDQTAFRKGAIACRDSNISNPSIRGTEMCNNWHNKGVCHEECPRAATHIRLRGQNLNTWKEYIEKVERKCADLQQST
jgi:hypothetical protein